MFESRSFADIEKSFASLSPFTAIAINFEIAKKIQTYSDEGISLASTLLPYLNKCRNFDFIPEEDNAYASRFASTLV